MEPTANEEPMTVEEYMQALIRIGFTRETVLGKCYDYATRGPGVRAGLPVLEYAARSCGIDRDPTYAAMMEQRIQLSTKA